MLPFKKVSPEVVAEIKEREEKAKVVVEPVNIAAERLKQKEENDRKILKEEYRRKQMIMKQIKRP